MSRTSSVPHIFAAGDVQAVTTAMAAGVDVATLARVEFAYPTYSAVIGVAARRLLRCELSGLPEVAAAR